MLTRIEGTKYEKRQTEEKQTEEKCREEKLEEAFPEENSFHGCSHAKHNQCMFCNLFILSSIGGCVEKRLVTACIVIGFEK